MGCEVQNYNKITWFFNTGIKSTYNANILRNSTMQPFNFAFGKIKFQRGCSTILFRWSIKKRCRAVGTPCLLTPLPRARTFFKFCGSQTLLTVGIIFGKFKRRIEKLQVILIQCFGDHCSSLFQTAVPGKKNFTVFALLIPLLAVINSWL